MISSFYCDKCGKQAVDEASMYCEECGNKLLLNEEENPDMTVATPMPNSSIYSAMLIKEPVARYLMIAALVLASISLIANIGNTMYQVDEWSGSNLAGTLIAMNNAGLLLNISVAAIVSALLLAKSDAS